MHSELAADYWHTVHSRLSCKLSFNKNLFLRLSTSSLTVTRPKMHTAVNYNIVVSKKQFYQNISHSRKR